MTRNTQGRMSRNAFLGLFKLIADKLELNQDERTQLMALWRSMVFPDELDEAVDEHVSEYH